MLSDSSSLGWWCHGRQVSGRGYKAGEGQGEGARTKDRLSRCVRWTVLLTQLVLVCKLFGNISIIGCSRFVAF